MENLVIRLDDDKWKALMVAQGNINLSSKRHDSPVSFLDALEKKGMLESQKRIPIAAIGQVSMLHGDDTVRFEWLAEKGGSDKIALECSSEEDARRLAEHVAAARNLRPMERAAGRWRAIGNGVIGLLVSLALTGITYSAAKQIEAGGNIHVGGRRAWLKVIIWGVAETLGPVGSLVIGLLISALFAAFVWKRWKQPPTELVWG
ncbi:MAG: hypothetical protein JNL05_11395 [Flavobacteriales bacterium]|nr:hypothetical protein [Flavobacteriales bacterium]